MGFRLPDAALTVDLPQPPSVPTECTTIHINTNSYTEGRKLRIAIVSGEKLAFQLELDVQFRG